MTSTALTRRRWHQDEQGEGDQANDKDQDQDKKEQQEEEEDGCLITLGGPTDNGPA